MWLIILGELILKKSYNVLPLLIKPPEFITCEFGFDFNGWSINCAEFGSVNEFPLFFESTEYCNLWSRRLLKIGQILQLK